MHEVTEIENDILLQVVYHKNFEKSRGIIMCYICNSYSGHEIGCPFAEAPERTFKCIECGQEVYQEETYHIYSSGKCICSKCAEEIL